jgi:hypothetical protein
MIWGIDYRDIAGHASLYQEFQLMKRAVETARAGKGCALCGDKNPGHPGRMPDMTIRVLCAKCKNEQEKINQTMAANRARLEQLEKRRRSL